MTLRILTAASALLALIATSCSPWPEPGQRYPDNRRPRQDQTVSSEEQQRIAAQRELKQKEQELKQKQAQDQQLPTNPDANTAPDVATNTTTDPNATPDNKPVKKEYPSASPVPGKDGFVFSPYNNRVLDVRGIPSGQLVKDTTYPAAEKKYFRVP